MVSIKKKLSCAALALLVGAALSGQALAMPSGGTVISGSVSGLNSDGSVTSSSILSTNGHSIINWNQFDIASDELFVVDTSNGALVNLVTGGNPSRIFGILSQGGSYPMFLFNPNGIVIGSGAHVYADNLLLSTLEYESDDFISNYLSKTGSVTFKTPAGRSVAASITFQNGAYVHSYTENGIKFMGGTIEVADGVTFSGGAIEYDVPSSIGLAALQSSTGNQYKESNVSTPDNTVTMGKATAYMNYSSEGSFNILGGNVSLNGTTIKLSRSGESDSKVNIVASNTFATDGQEIGATYTADNKVSLNNTSITANNVHIYGGQVTQSNTTLNGDNIQIRSLGDSDSDGYAYSDPVILGLLDSSLQLKVTNSANSQTEQPAKADELKEVVTMSTETGQGGSAAGMNVTVTPGLIAIARASSDTHGLSVEGFVQLNISNGYQSMQEVMDSWTMADTPQVRLETVQDLVSRVDSSSILDEGAKAAQAVGMMEAIETNNELDEEEKKKLKRAVAYSFKSLSDSTRKYLADVASSAALRVK